MSTLKVSRAALAAMLPLAGAAAWAQGPAAAEGSDMQVFVTERLWNARWDLKLIDATVTAAPTATSPAEVMITLRQRSSVKLVPIHSVGLRYKDLLVSASGWSASFDMGELTTTGRSKRRELDLTLGYTVYPGVTAALTYKQGKVDPAVSARATALLGLTGRQKGEGVLLGISAVAPLAPRLSLYGTLAYGLGRYQVETTLEGSRTDARYTLGDFGAGYRFDPPDRLRAIESITVQLGYRFQVVMLRGANLKLPASAAARITNMNDGTLQTTTQGMVLSAGLAF